MSTLPPAVEAFRRDSGGGPEGRTRHRRGGGVSRRRRYFASARLITMRWISLVPSKIV